MKISTHTSSMAVVAPANKPAAPTPSEGASPDKVSLLDRLQAREKQPLTLNKMLLNTAYSAGAGALCGQFIDSHQGRSIAVNAVTCAAVGGLGLGLTGGMIGLMGGPRVAAKGAAAGLVAGGVLGGAFGAAAGQVNYMLNHALPWSPAINGAVIGGAMSLVGGIWTLATQKPPAEPAPAPSAPEGPKA